MSDQGNGGGQTEPRAACAVTLVLLSSGAMGIHAHADDERHERKPSLGDLTGMAAQLAQWCQVQSVLAAMEERKRNQARVLPFRGVR